MFYGLATGVFIASYTVVDGYAVKVLLMSPILLDYFGNFVRLGLLAPAVLRDRPAAAALWRQQWKYALVVAAISPVGYVLVLYAMQVAPLSHVAPAREVSMLFAALIGGRLLGEGDRLLRIAGAACIAVGVMALALG
jgi:drug/metabolite transporter (DMT)-like permease